MKMFDELPCRYELDLHVSQTTMPIGRHVPVRLEGFRFALPNGRRIAIRSLFIVRLDLNGSPMVFDEDKAGDEQYRVPFRFDLDHAGKALPFNAAQGDLIFLACATAEKQRYAIHFALDDGSDDGVFYGGLIGDGEPFVQVNGRLCVPGFSAPVEYGDRLFGRKGLVVGAGYKMGIYFFENLADDSSPSPRFVNRGRLKDADGNVIWGIPTFHDIDGDGVIDLVVGRNDGTLWIYRNNGSNVEPLFAPPVPLCMRDGAPINLCDYLRDKTMVVKFKDGSVNPRYPEMPIIQSHGGQTHVYTTPQFVSLRGDGVRDLIVGAGGGFLLWFKREKDGYCQGKFLTGADKQILRVGHLPHATDWGRGGVCDILAGDYHGWVHRMKGGFENDEPIFSYAGKINQSADYPYSFPMFIPRFHGRSVILIGTHQGEVMLYPVTTSGKKGEPFLGEKSFLEMERAWVSGQMSVTRYADMDGDGRSDLLVGDIQGKFYFFRNVGTERSPLFAHGVRLSTQNGLVEVVDGPDPQSPEDGYAKPVVAKMSGKPCPDILTGTGLGRIVYFEINGKDVNGNPTYKDGRVLRDTAGNEIMSHHMSAVEFGDWDGDGIPDLIVGGQRGVHAMKDDDPDAKTQVRWYKGRMADDGIVFEPYKALSAEGDSLFQYRPVPISIREEGAKKVLYVSGGIYRQVDKNHPEAVEFVRHVPPFKLRGEETFISAYPSFSALGRNDPLAVMSSCVGCVYAFRESFVMNGGYLRCQVKMRESVSHDGAVGQAERVEFWSGKDKGGAVLRPNVTKGRGGPFVRQPLRLEDSESQALSTVHRDFTCLSDQRLIEEIPMEVSWYHTDESIGVLIWVTEPLMERLITETDHRNGPVGGDDHVEIILDPDTDAKRYYGWEINSSGNYKESQYDRDTDGVVGPWRIGHGKVFIESVRKPQGYAIHLQIPFGKLDGFPKKGPGCLCEVRRCRAIYSNEFRAREQRFSGVISWSGERQGRVRLVFAPIPATTLTQSYSGAQPQRPYGHYDHETQKQHETKKRDTGRLWA